MSDKLIRDELLRSHRYVSLSNDTTKLLFLHLMLSSDSLSNAEATTTALSLAMGRHITEGAAGTMLNELGDHDLVRVYENQGKRYVHIPRSRQRIRYLSGKHPRPPVGVEDKEIRELIAKVGLKSDRGQAQVGPFSPEVKRSVVVVTEELNTLSSSAKAPNIDVAAILKFLNDKTGRQYRPTPVNLDFIRARIKEGYSERELRAVIARKCREWKGDDQMDQYLRPKTLFNRANFSQYVAEVPQEKEPS